MASVYRPKGTKYWWGRVQRNGKLFRRSLRTTTRTVAEKRLRQWLDEQEAAQWGEKPLPLYSDAMLAFLQGHCEQIKPASKRRYMVSARALNPHFKGLTLGQITHGKLSEFEAARRRDGASAPTIRRDLACLSSMIETAITEQDLEMPNVVPSYLKKRRRRGVLKEAPPRTRYLAMDEEAELLLHASPYLRPMISFAIDTGLRLEEQLSLRWDRHIYTAHSEIRLSPADTKTDIGRAVPLLPRAKQILHNLPRHFQSPYVFHKRETGERYQKLTRGLAGAAKRAGIKDLRWHDLRRTCGCRLLQDHGMSIEQVSKWLGHATIAQTQRSYAFLEVEQLHAGIKMDIGRADES